MKKDKAKKHDELRSEYDLKKLKMRKVGPERNRTIQITLEDDLVQAVDRISKQLHISRSEFTRKALREALARYNTEQQEGKHREGYERHPVAEDEFSVWESEQIWPDE